MKHAMENSGYTEQSKEKPFGHHKKVPEIKEEGAKFTEESVEDGNEYGQLEKTKDEDGGGRLKVEYIPKQNLVIKNPNNNRMDLMKHAIDKSGYNEQSKEKLFGHHRKVPKVEEEGAKYTEESVEDGNEYGQVENKLNPNGSTEDEEGRLQVEYFPKKKEFGENYDQPIPYGQQPAFHPIPNVQELPSQHTPNKEQTFDQQPSSQPTSYEQQSTANPITNIQKLTSSPTQNIQDPLQYEQQPSSQPPQHDQNNQRNTESCSCGQSNTFEEEQMNSINRQFEEHERVIGGTEAIANSFPWIVRIRGGCAGKIYHRLLIKFVSYL